MVACDEEDQLPLLFLAERRGSWEASEGPFHPKLTILPQCRWRLTMKTADLALALFPVLEQDAEVAPFGLASALEGPHSRGPLHTDGSLWEAPFRSSQTEGFESWVEASSQQAVQ